MKLKTLKDFKHFGTFAEEGDEYIEIKELKAEAIKWYKATDKGEINPDVEGFIFEFFNISEEDLKGGLDFRKLK